PLNQRVELINDSLANGQLLRAQDLSEWSIAPPLQKAKQNHNMALCCLAIESGGVGKAKKRGQTGRVIGDCAIERSHVVDTDILPGGHTTTGGPIARASGRRRSLLKRRRRTRDEPVGMPRPIVRSLVARGCA